MNTLNRKLTVEAASARKRAEGPANSMKLTAQWKPSRSGGCRLHIKGAQLQSSCLQPGDRVTDRSGRGAHDLSLTLSRRLAPGPIRVYVRVTDPEGFLLQDGTNASFNFNGEAMAATASREVDYTGSDVDLSIYINNIPEYVKGVYTAEVFTEQALLGKTEILLR